MVNGIAQKPIEGVSMAYTFDKARSNRRDWFIVTSIHTSRGHQYYRKCMLTPL